MRIRFDDAFTWGRKQFFWADEEEEKLRELILNTNWSYARIAKEFPGKTRKLILGKYHRDMKENWIPDRRI